MATLQFRVPLTFQGLQTRAQPTPSSRSRQPFILRLPSFQPSRIPSCSRPTASFSTSTALSYSPNLATSGTDSCHHPERVQSPEIHPTSRSCPAPNPPPFSTSSSTPPTASHAPHTSQPLTSSQQPSTPWRHTASRLASTSRPLPRYMRSSSRRRPSIP